MQTWFCAVSVSIPADKDLASWVGPFLNWLAAGNVSGNYQSDTIASHFVTSGAGSDGWFVPSTEPGPSGFFKRCDIFGLEVNIPGNIHAEGPAKNYLQDLFDNTCLGSKTEVYDGNAISKYFGNANVYATKQTEPTSNEPCGRLGTI